jgi:Flp pilus assembly protein TadD
MTDAAGMLADDAMIAALVARMTGPVEQDLALVDAMLTSHSNDARLHFLRGSLLAGEGRSVEAHRTLRHAVDLAPDFAIARFQLGFFELTSGEVDQAMQSWAALANLPDAHYLRAFVSGLSALVADRFADCIAALERGIAANTNNQPLNIDMALIIDQCRAELNAADGTTRHEPAPTATSLLLNQFGNTPQ